MKKHPARNEKPPEPVALLKEKLLFLVEDPAQRSRFSETRQENQLMATTKNAEGVDGP